MIRLQRVAPPRRSPVARRRGTVLAILTMAFAVAVYGFGSGTAVSAGPSTFRFTGSGFGHAVGMSQWGARGMAAADKTVDQILTHYYTGTTVGTGHAVSPEVRVLLTQKQNSVAFTAQKSSAAFGPFGTVAAEKTVTATRSGNQIVLSGAISATTAGPVSVTLNPATAGLRVSATGDAYRLGTLRLSLDPNGGLRVVVAGLTMQQYLYGMGEMPSSWPAAALQAQAIASRTYAQKQIEARKHSSLYPDFDLSATTIDQSYRGTRFEAEGTHSNWTKAVDATIGRFVLYGGNLIDAVYSASSGGHTEDSEFVWVSKVAYLRGVDDPADLTGGNPSASWTRDYTAAELGAWFNVGVLTSTEVVGPVRPSGHLDKVSIRLVGTKGTVTVTGAGLRSTINSKAGGDRYLRSTKFSISGSVTSSETPPPTPPKPPTPTNTMATGTVTVASATGKTVRIAGTVRDPDGAPLVRIVSTMGSERAVRDRRVTNGGFDVSWNGSPGTRNVCVTVYDVPTNRGVSLGCRNVVVK